MYGNNRKKYINMLLFLLVVLLVFSEDDNVDNSVCDKGSCISTPETPYCAGCKSIKWSEPVPACFSEPISCCTCDQHDICTTC